MHQQLKKMSLIGLILMIFTSVFGFANSPSAFYLMGYSAMPFYLFSALFFFIPFALMMAEMGHRMPLRHEMHQLILAGFREHGIDMPFPPFQMRLESIDGRQSSKTMTSAGKTSRRTAGSL